MANQDTAAEPLEPDALSWREQAVARSLDSARLRAETRVQRFLDAAIELFNAGSGKDFTVQEVVDRSGQSLRSFYQYFGGKHELLLALFEESVRSTTEYLQDQIAAYRRPSRASPHLRRGVLPALPAEPGGIRYGRAGAVHGRVRPAAAHRVPQRGGTGLLPLVALFEQVLDGAASAGAVRTGPRRGPIVGVVLEAIMFNSFSSTIGGMSVRSQGDGTAEDLWDLIFHGIGTGSAD